MQHNGVIPSTLASFGTLAILHFWVCHAAMVIPCVWMQGEECGPYLVGSALVHTCGLISAEIA